MIIASRLGQIDAQLMAGRRLQYAVRNPFEDDLGQETAAARVLMIGRGKRNGIGQRSDFERTAGCVAAGQRCAVDELLEVIFLILESIGFLMIV